MNRTLRTLSVYLAAFLILMLYFAGQDSAFDSVFRLHILANSDTAEDQRVKLLVRDAVLAWADQAAEAEDAEAVKARLMEDAATLQSAVEAVLADNGAAYGATLSVGTYAFPDKEYADLLYPAGDYAALRVVLGEGKGQNWWCVMFPPLCILELPNGDIEYEGDAVKFNSLFLNWLKGVNKDLWKRIEESWR